MEQGLNRVFISCLTGPFICLALCGIFLGPAPGTASEEKGSPHRPPQLSSPAAHSDFGIVATGSPEATRAAVEILERGGNAIDAAVTAALVLGVADYDASGIGGATNIVIRLANGHTTAIDGTAVAPASLDLAAFRRLKSEKQRYGAEFIAVPTTLATLQLALDRYGTIQMADALQPAIEVAEGGFRLGQIQNVWTEYYLDDILTASPFLRFFIMEDGSTIDTAGELQCRPVLAETLRRLAREGVNSFYRGAIADEIEADMIAHGGFLRKTDLAGLQVHEVQPFETTYRGCNVYTFPAPGGGPTLVNGLDILEAFPSSFLATDSLDRLHVLVEALRLARAGRIIAFTRSAPPLAFQKRQPRKKNAARLARIIKPGSVISEARLTPNIPANCLPSNESTTHVSIIDQWGNTVSMTQSLARSFGAKVVTPGLGFPYNGFLESFNATDPKCPGYLRPNLPCGTDMAPTIVVDEGRSVTALGSPGSMGIPSILAIVISNLVDRNASPAEAVNSPRILWGGSEKLSTYVEIVDPVTETDATLLEGYGHKGLVAVRFPSDPVDMATAGGVNLAHHDLSKGVFSGVIDGRRGGLALGPRVVMPPPAN